MRMAAESLGGDTHRLIGRHFLGVGYGQPIQVSLSTLREAVAGRTDLRRDQRAIREGRHNERPNRVERGAQERLGAAYDFTKGLEGGVRDDGRMGQPQLKE